MSQLEDLWRDGVAAQQGGDFASACTQFSNWKQEAGKLSLASAEVEMNLALCQARLERWDLSVESLFRAVNLSSSPITRYALLSETEKIQERLGVREQVMGITNQVHWIFPAPLLHIGISLGVWGTLIPVVYWFKNRKRSAALPVSIASGFFLLLLTSGILLGIARFAPAAAIVSGNDPEAAVFSNVEGKEESILVQLPRGTVVLKSEIPSKAEGLVRIEAPVVGYVSGDKLTAVDHNF